MTIGCFFKHISPPAKKIASTVAVSVPFSLALNYHDRCKRYNEPMSFSNYLTFSASLMKAVMKGKSQSPNNQPIEDQTKFRNI
ncbi:MAG: hypothetical protein Q8R83_08160 [Legionellaceae bacterium]|nr:hypothetical protein [Legionellaceae bacterium]